MREIKFRGLSVDNVMIFGYGCYIDQSENEFIVNEDVPDNSFIIIKKGTLSQYTGLKDKNKKEIYRGDIVLVTPVGWIDKEHECESCRQYKIEVKDVLDEMKKEIRCQPFFHNYRELEIIGNIEIKEISL